MKKIINFSLNNKFAIWILTIMVTVAGLYAGLNMKQETMPNITMPNVSVMTTYPGASPDEVASGVTEQIEKRVQNINGVKLVSSNSLESASSVQVEFDYDKDMDKASDEVQNALDDLDLPEGANEPVVSRLSINAFPVMSLSISNSDQNLEQLSAKVEDDVIPVLEGIDGVADVQVSGQQVQEVNVKFDQDALTEYGLTEDTIKQIIQGSNLSFPLGLTNFDDEVKNLVIDGNVASVEDFKNLEIPITPSPSAQQEQAGQTNQAAQDGQGAQAGQAPQGGQSSQTGLDEQAGQDMPTDSEVNQENADSVELPTVALKDLATIEITSESESISKTNGEDSIGVQIVKAQESNTVDVVNGVKDEISNFEELGLTVTSTFDQGEPIEDSVNTMLNKAIFGAIFAVIIILLFLRSMKTTFISIISIPLSLLMAILLLNQMDITLNIMTLGALTVAIGRVIDDSIVVIENIYRRMSLSNEKLQGKDLILEATREMFVPICSSTIVTIAVFLPLGLVSGQVGELFLPFALAVVFALLASLLVAVTIVPMLAHSLFRKSLNEVGKTTADGHRKKTGKLANFYKGILKWALNHKGITFGGAVVVLAASLFLIPVIGVSFLPEEEQKMVIATYSPEPGQTQENVQEVANDAEAFFSNRDGVNTYQYSIGGGNESMSMMGMGGNSSALFFIEYDDDYENFSEESSTVIDQLNKDTDKGEWGTLDFTSTGGSGLELFVYGDSTEEIQAAVDKILPIMEGKEDLDNIESSLSDSYDQYTLVANQEKLSKYGLTAAQIGMNLRGTGEAPVLTTIKNDGEDINVYVEVEEKDYNSIDDMKEIEIETPLGTSVKVEDVMDIEEGKSPDTITRRGGEMYASLSADILSNDAAAVSNEVADDVDRVDLGGATVEFGGVTEQINESFTQLGLAMLAAIAIVYFVLVVTFGGALAPFAILFSLPFTVIGGLVALWIANEPLSVSAMIGALMLIGIVVTNAIVLIDRVIHKEKEGLSTREALLEAGSTRLRPILMTAIATVGALIPLAIGAEGGGLISKGLGVTVIGGLTSSTILTLVIVPIVYEVVSKFRKKKS
ncbi:efflux RND transporter permease subunit [Aquibacillus sp. 3ASR75-11]|uniref:Efflux RND transporter permease subunit n=1 Tax=Terrihalobacillus insolitus TaxID=2950438 RepID=A0A9X3WRK3_9BACI|nr:efflux RND transporter permease subunit [Terrihalobacillus insolitus]MDC3424050.1 efflux RND transporter permease subunit [Terrihalobacillus insolitus]